MPRWTRTWAARSTIERRSIVEALIATGFRLTGTFPPAGRPSKALRDQADVALLRGDVPDPDEGW